MKLALLSLRCPCRNLYNFSTLVLSWHCQWTLCCCWDIISFPSQQNSGPVNTPLRSNENVIFGLVRTREFRSFFPHVQNYLSNLLMDLSARKQLRSVSFSSNQLHTTRHLIDEKIFVQSWLTYPCQQSNWPDLSAWWREWLEHLSRASNLYVFLQQI
jgi:hypothetical protein